MRLVIERGELLRALGHVTSVVERRTTIPILSNVLLRASERALDESKSTDLAPVQTHAEADLQPVPSDEYVLARLSIFPFAHAFRAGSRIRISVDTPGPSRAEWLFILDDTQTDAAR